MAQLKADPLMIFTLQSPIPCTCKLYKCVGRNVQPKFITVEVQSDGGVVFGDVTSKLEGSWFESWLSFCLEFVCCMVPVAVENE